MNYSKKPGETRTFVVDLSGKLEGALSATLDPSEVIEVLTGTPTVTELSSADLTITSVEINASERTFGGLVYPANQAVEFTVSGGTARTDYTLRVTATTDGTPAQTLIEDIRLQVL